MKRIGNLFESAVSLSALTAAARRAKRGTKATADVCKFQFNLEHELLALREELLTGMYYPRPYRYFTVNDPKRRTIAVADFRDRVVHHSVVGAIEPVFERTFIHDSYATRKGKGAHAAVFRAQAFLRKNHWFFKADIEKYFESVRHEVLLNQIARKIKDERMLALIARILKNGGSSQGLPIGNLTSQFFANVYLHDFDLFVKHELRIRYYLRYMDDFVLFFPDKEDQQAVATLLETWLSDRLFLRLKKSNTFHNKAQNGLSFLGTRIFPGLIRFHPQNARRAQEKLLQQKMHYESGRINSDAWRQSLQSYHGIFSVYGTHGLRKHIYEQQGLLA